MPPVSVELPYEEKKLSLVVGKFLLKLSNFKFCQYKEMI